MVKSLPDKNEYRYEVIMFWDLIDDWVLWKDFMGLENALDHYDHATQQWKKLPIMLYDRWSEEVVAQQDGEWKYD